MARRVVSAHMRPRFHLNLGPNLGAVAFLPDTNPGQEPQWCSPSACVLAGNDDTFGRPEEKNSGFRGNWRE